MTSYLLAITYAQRCSCTEEDNLFKEVDQEGLQNHVSYDLFAVNSMPLNDLVNGTTNTFLRLQIRTKPSCCNAMLGLLLSRIKLET